MCEYVERNGSAQDGFKTSCKREAYPYLRGKVPYRTVPKSHVNAAFVFIVPALSNKEEFHKSNEALCLDLLLF